MLLAALTFAPLGSALAQPCAFLDPPDPSADLPDDGYVDANGDGIDGMRCGPIFVSPLGSDANLGTTSAPMRTIGAAILAARAFTPPRDVYIGYASSVSIVSQPSYGSAASSGNVLSYAPGAESSELDVFEYNACRTTGGCRSGFAVVALPEPGIWLGLTTGVSILAALRARRRSTEG